MSNPWMNQLKKNNNPEPPKPVETKPVEPIKPQTPQTNVLPQSNQAPWKKNDSPVTQPPSQGTWMKPAENTTGQSPFGSQIGIKKPENTTVTASTNQPAWMKGSTEQQPNTFKQGGQTNTNKIGFGGGSKIESIKQKKQRQQRQKLQKQRLQKQQQQKKRKEQEQQRLKKEEQERIRKAQEQRLERQRIEEQRRKQEQLQKQKKREIEKKNMQRQLNAMKNEQLHSIQREKYDAQQEQLKKKSNKNRGNKSNNNNKNKNSRLTQSKSKKSMVLAFDKKAKNKDDNSIATRYLSQFQKLFLKYEVFKEKLDAQTELLKVVADFRQKTQQNIKKLVNQSKINQKYVQQHIIYNFALSNSKNQFNKIIYDQTKIKNIKHKFQLYDIIQNSILSIIKKIGIFKLRVPLINFMEYRGVCCLAVASTIQEQDLVASQIYKVNEIQTQIDLLQKQIKLNHPKFKSDVLLCKKIYNQNEQEIYMIYIKDNVSKIKQRKPAVKMENFESLDWINNYNNKGFSCSIKNLINLKQQKNLYVKQYIDSLLLAKCIHKIYRSCQGQIQQLHFWNLIITQDKQIWKMIQNAGFKGEFIKKGILLKFIEIYSAIRFQFDADVFETETPFTAIKQIKVKSLAYSLQKFDIIQLSNKYYKYMKENRIELAAQAILLRYQLAKIHQTKEQKINLVLDHAELLSFQKKYNESIEQALKVEEQIEVFQFSRIRMLGILIKNYNLLDDQENLLKNFQLILKQINFNFGQQNSIHCTLYSILGYFYANKKNLILESINLYQLSLGIAMKIYGSNSIFCGDIYFDIAKNYTKFQKIPQAQYNLEQASKIYNHHNLKAKLAQILVLMSKIENLKGKQKQSVQKLQRAIKIYKKLDKVNELFELYQLRLSTQRNFANKNKIIQTILNLGIHHNKNHIIKKAYQLALIQQIPKVPRSKINKLMQIYEQCVDFQESILEKEVQANKKNFTSICQMIRWAFNLIDASTGIAGVQKATLLDKNSRD